MRSPYAVSALVALITAITPGLAAAQAAPVTPAAPQLPPVVVPPRADPPGTAASDAIALPMRLSLLSSVAPLSPPGGCSQPSVDAAGTILPVQPYVHVQLTMHLTLEVVSNLGCPGDPYAVFDTGMGAALTYSAALRPNLWLVAAAGAYATSTGVPGRPGGARPVVTGLDLVSKSASGQTTSVGVGTVSNTRGARVMARVGGSF
jgi:hypothetical protein